MNPTTSDVQMATGLPPFELLRQDEQTGQHTVTVDGHLAFEVIDRFNVSYLTDRQIFMAARIAAAGPLLLWAVRDALNAIDVHNRIDNPGEDSIDWGHHADHLKLAFKAATGEEWPS